MIAQSEIMKIVKEYAKSPQGKAKIKNTYGVEYIEKVDAKKLKRYGEEMKTILFRHMSPLIDSITMDDIIVSTVEPVEGGYRLKISFNPDSLRRDSLYLDGYYGDDALEDIVLLFSRGYHARDYVYGHWVKPGQSIAAFQRTIKSCKDRDPNPFLSKAVEEFNDKTEDWITAKLEGEYDDENSGAP